MKTAIWWITNDQRLDDNSNLIRSLEECDQVIPVYVWDESIKRCSLESRQGQFTLESLEILERRLKTLGSYLVFKKGNSLDEILRIIHDYKVEEIYVQSNFTPRFNSIYKRLKSFVSVNLSLDQYMIDPKKILKSDGYPYLTFSSFLRALKIDDLKFDSLYQEPKYINSPQFIDIPKISKSRNSSIFKADLEIAEARLDWFLEEKIFKYNVERNRLDLDGTSMLSPYFSSGILSIKKVFRDILNIDINLNNKGIKSWFNELVWREFNMYIMFHFPETINSSFKNKLENYPWENDSQFLLSWQKGETGYPVVDACMKQLLETGWMHNRGRMIVASFLTKDLFIDWREGEKWFMENLVDADTASNVGGWQWTAGSGVDAAPYFRIFNPIIQGKKFDPFGLFVKKYIEVLRGIPERFIHEPWELDYEFSKKLPLYYKKPIVEHIKSREKALKIFQDLKK